MFVAALWPAVLGAFAVLASAKPTRTSPPTKRQTAPEPAPEVPNLQFVTTETGKFTVNGNPLNFVGTNAYWLHTLNSDEDIDYTLGNISAAGIKVVRTWAFNDVTTVPETGTWFQLINNDGTVTINEGANGLQKLDRVVQLAEKHGIYLLLALTNNWNPDPAFDDINIGAGPSRRSDITLRQGDGNNPPRNFLSNDYGGMDTYVRQFGLKHHDEFYTNPKVIDAFKNFTAHIVKRYCKSTSIFGWELANDARCNSTLSATTCNPKVVTQWHSTLAQHVASVDTNHLVSSGNGGHFCLGCPKLFPQAPPPPPPQVSPAPGVQRRAPGGFLTIARVLQDRAAARKRNRQAKRNVGGGVKIRGQWTSTPTRRQDQQEIGPSFDGSYGVDSEDILNIPEIGFGSLQLFPDQHAYGPDDPNLTRFQNIVERGSAWIRQHAAAAEAFGKPTVLNGFGLVTQNNAPNYVPFDSTEAPYASDGGSPPAEQPYGVTTEQRDEAFTAWINEGAVSGLKSVIHYQWGQDGLSAQPGTTVSTATSGTGVGEGDASTGISPNDGYSTNGIGRDSAVAILEAGSQQYAADSKARR